jgi:hypothetical protein
MFASKPSESRFGVLATAALLLIVLILGCAPVVRPARAAGQTFAGIIIPLYTYPTDSSWSSVIQAKQAYPGVPFIVIVSPASGPGRAPDPYYVAGIKDLQAAGITTVGYVFTDYGSRSPASVEADVNSYASWYHVNGIFFDQMSNVPGFESYYSNLDSYVHGMGMSTTIGNPGTSVPDSFIGTMDIICVYESSGYPSLSFISYPGYSQSNFYVIPYGVGLSSSFLSQAAAGYAGWFYVTDASGANPYDVLPSYFYSEVATLSSMDSVATLTVDSVTLSGAPLVGLWTVLSQGGSLLSTGFTPDSFTGSTGGLYTVSVSNYGNDVFCHWEDGTTSAARSVSLGSNTALTAYYSTSGSCNTTYPVTIDSSSVTGTGFSGMWLTVLSGGAVVAQGFTPLTFTASSSSQYQVEMSNYAQFTFQYWNTGSASATLDISPSQATTLTAYYTTGGQF